jgi:signal transduction histidine kinase
MMNLFFKNARITHKLIMINLLTTGLAFLLAGTVMVIAEYVSFRNILVSSTTAQARIIANNSTASLTFNDPRAAAETLKALKASPNIECAAIYGKDGKIFADYCRAETKGAPPALPANEGHFFADGHLHIFQGIVLDQETIGSLYIRSDLEKFYALLLQFGVTAAATLVIVFAITFLLLSRLQRVISAPISDLARSMQLVSQEKNYTIKANVHAEDEIGALAQGFNEMLEQIKLREMKLNIEIAEHKSAEEALAEKARDLVRSNAELEQFAYAASHDLQEPLRMVGSYVQLLERRYKGRLDSEADEFIAYAVEGATRMKRLINDLLAISLVGGGDREMKNLDMEGILTLVLAKRQETIKESAAIITHDPLPAIIANHTEMVRLFEHLLDNALKFHGQAPPCIHIKAEKTGNDCLFSVRDNGIGIEPAYFDKIFRLFQRLNSREEYPGTGIGLAECKKIVERHGGKIWLESEPGKGTTFYFTLPVERRKRKEEPTTMT